MIIENFKKLYQSLNMNNIDTLGSVYAAEINFIDPFQQITNLQELQTYFYGLYENIESISFEFGDVVSQGNCYYIPWSMSLQHSKLNNGNVFKTPGVTCLKVAYIAEVGAERIVFHRDYFDAGKLLYEQLPMIRTIIRWIKRKF